MGPEYWEGFDAGFDNGINQLLFFIDQYELTEDNTEFKLACTKIREDIHKYFSNEEGRYGHKTKDELEGVSR